MASRDRRRQEILFSLFFVLYFFLCLCIITKKCEVILMIYLVNFANMLIVVSISYLQKEKKLQTFSEVKILFVWLEKKKKKSVSKK